jgi:hypothetical protein
MVVAASRLTAAELVTQEARILRRGAGHVQVRVDRAVAV